MKRTVNRSAHALLLLVALAVASATTLAADLSGAWAVDGDVYGNAVKYTLTLKQEGDTLSGTARIQDKDVPVTGTVTDKTVKWQFDVDYNGSPLKLEFTGTPGTDADIKGTIAVSGASGTFTAKRQ